MKKKKHFYFPQHEIVDKFDTHIGTTNDLCLIFYIFFECNRYGIVSFSLLESYLNTSEPKSILTESTIISKCKPYQLDMVTCVDFVRTKL